MVRRSAPRSAFRSNRLRPPRINDAAGVAWIGAWRMMAQAAA